MRIHSRPLRHRWAPSVCAVAVVVAGGATALALGEGRAAAASCQPSHAFAAIGFGGPALVEDGGTIQTDTSVNLYPTGVVKPQTKMVYTFTDFNTGTTIRVQTTAPAGSNCVVRHEDEEFSLGALGARKVNVVASYTRWEDGTTVIRPLGALRIRSGGQGVDSFSALCGRSPNPSTVASQPSKVWIAIGNTGLSLAEGGGTTAVSFAETLYPTGIVDQGRSATFRFQSLDSGRAVERRTGVPNVDSCVIPSELEAFSAAQLGVGSYRVTATYIRMETQQPAFVDLGVLAVEAR